MKEQKGFKSLWKLPSLIDASSKLASSTDDENAGNDTQNQETKTVSETSQVILSTQAKAGNAVDTSKSEEAEK